MINSIKTLFSFLSLFLLGATLSFAQSPTLKTSYLNISHKKAGETIFSQSKIEGLAADQFDVPSFLLENKADEIRIFGSATDKNEIITFSYNSKKINQPTEADNFCQEVVSIEKKPFLGVGMKTTKDFNGVEIIRVIENSAAADAGLTVGQIITFVGEEPIHSPCDLRIAISQSLIGDNVDIEIIDGHTETKVPTTIGYRLKKTISWIPCNKEDLVEANPSTGITQSSSDLLVFPNPSEGLTQIEYTSDLSGALIITVNDLAGREIYRNEVSNFYGFHQENLDFTNEASGLYTLNIIQGVTISTKKIIIQKK